MCQPEEEIEKMVGIESKNLAMGNKEEAEDAVDKAKNFIEHKAYTEARTWMKRAMKLYPTLDNALEKLIICDTLYYGDMNFPNLGIDWYSLLHLHPSATDTEVKLQSKMLVTCAKFLELDRFPGASRAKLLLTQAKFVLSDEANRLEFDRKREFSGLVDLPYSSKKTSFEDKYLGWEQPVFKPISGGVHRKKKLKSNVLVSTPERGKKIGDQVFYEMPQKIHTDLRNGKRGEEKTIAWEVDFEKLCVEIVKLDGPESFWCKVDGFMERVAKLDEMGYNVDKLRECLEVLKRIAERDRMSREALGKLEAEVKEHENKMNEQIGVLKKAVDKFVVIFKEHEDRIAESKAEIDKRVPEIGNLKKDSVKALDEFASTIKSMFK